MKLFRKEIVIWKTIILQFTFWYHTGYYEKNIKCIHIYRQTQIKHTSKHTHTHTHTHISFIFVALKYIIRQLKFRHYNIHNDMLHLTAQIVLPPDFILVYLWYRLCIWLQHAVAPPPVSFRNTGFSWTYGILHSCITLALLRFAVINWKKYDFLAWNRDFSHEIPKIFSRLPPQLETIWFFGVKSWFFTRNTPNIFAPPSARRNFFKCAPPNLKSCIRPCGV